MAKYSRYYWAVLWRLNWRRWQRVLACHSAPMRTICHSGRFTLREKCLDGTSRWRPVSSFPWRRVLLRAVRFVHACRIGLLIGLEKIVRSWSWPRSTNFSMTRAHWICSVLPPKRDVTPNTTPRWTLVIRHGPNQRNWTLCALSVAWRKRTSHRRRRTERRC